MTRRLLFRILLTALAASAVLGVTAIFASSNTTWRLLGTAMTVVFAALFMVPFVPGESAGRLDIFRRTMIAYLGVSAAIVVALIWSVPLIPGVSLEWPAFIWFYLGLCALIVAIPALRHRRLDDRSLSLAERIAIWGAMGSVALAFVAMAVLPGVQSDFETSLSLGFIVLGGVVMAAASATGLRTPSTDRFAPLVAATAVDRAAGWIGLAGAIGWTLLAAAARIDDHYALAAAIGAGGPYQRQTSPLWPIAIPLATIGLACGIGCILGLSRVRSPLRFLRHAAVATTIALGVLWTYASWRTTFVTSAQFDPFDRLLWQLSSALLIVDISALASGLILMRLHRAPGVGSDPIESLDWTCPRCATKATIGLGEHRCTGCALAVRIQLRDDRCPACGYDLHAQPPEAPQCPECGRVRQVSAGV
jgi:hypothetical protein